MWSWVNLTPEHTPQYGEGFPADEACPLANGGLTTGV
jgi:hypothetical protein